MSDIWWLDATAQADLVRRNDVHPVELVEAAIARVEALDPAINAVVIRRFELAIEDARGPLPDGPFRGVPLLLKDGSQPSANDPWHLGSRAAKAAGHMGTVDGYSVAALRRAGFVFIGRTNVPEFCSWPSTEPAAYGPTRNPWDLERTAGGSSGGSAAAVAAGMTACATGSDAGGSIRWPAAACGVIGLKPSRGRVSDGPDVGHHWGGLSTDGPITRSVRDAAALLDIMSAADLTAPYAPFRPDLDFLALLDEPLAPLRIGICPEPPTGQPGDRERADAVGVVGAALADRGHQVELAWPAALADLSSGPSSRVFVAAQVSAEIAAWEERLGLEIADDELEPINRMYREWSRETTAADYLAAEAVLHSYARRLVSWWTEDGYDLLITPTMSIPTPPLSWFDTPSADGNWSDMFNYLGPFNISGQPGVSFPGGIDSNGMPVGVQLIAGPGRDDVALRAALQLEQALPGVRRLGPQC